MALGQPLRRIVATLLSLVLTFVATTPALASHTANCSEYGFKHHQNGYVSTSWANHRFGIRATFDGQSLDLCLNPRQGEGSASTAWVAIQGPPAALGIPFGNIVQMGYGKCRVGGEGCNILMQDGYAWGRWSGSPGCSGYSDRAPTGRWLGSWSGAGAYSVIEEADGDFQLNSPLHGIWISDASICWTNETVAVFVETLDYGDGLGGFVGNTVDFTQKQFRTAPGGAWLSLPTLCNGRLNAPDPPFECAPNGETLTLWTDRN